MLAKTLLKTTMGCLSLVLAAAIAPSVAFAADTATGVSDLTAATTAISADTGAVLSTQDSGYTASDVVSVEFKAMRPLILGVDESLAEGIGANVTMKDGKTVYVEYGYDFEYDYDQPDGGTYYKLNDVGWMLSECSTFKGDVTRVGKAQATIELDAETFKDVKYNKTVQLDVIANPVVGISVPAGTETKRVVVDDLGNSFADEAQRTDVIIKYADGTTASMSDYDPAKDGSGQSFSGWAYDDGSSSLFFMDTKVYGSSFDNRLRFHAMQRHRIEYVLGLDESKIALRQTYPLTIRYMGHEVTTYVRFLPLSDEEAAIAVETLIDELPKPLTIENESLIVQAEAAYGKLTADQKALVSNYQALKDARTTLDALKAEAEKAKEAEAEKAKKVNLSIGDVTVSNSVYNGKAFSPQVKLDGKALEEGADYTLAFKNAKGKTIGASAVKAAGTYKVTITGKGAYDGAVTKTFKITKAKNTLVAKAKAKTNTVKWSKLKKKSQTITKAKAFKISKAKGKVTFKKANKAGGKKITVSKSGKVTVKKGLKKGTYKVKVKVTAKGNANYKAATKTVTLKIRVK